MSEGDFDYSKQFRVAVERSGKSVPQLAKESGVSTFTWYGLIRGQRAPRLTRCCWRWRRWDTQALTSCLKSTKDSGQL